MHSIREAVLQGRNVLIRVDFNVPLDENQQITDDRRIRASLPTINYALEKGAAVILIAHLGRPKGEPKAEFSLKHIHDHLSELLERPVMFVEDCGGASARTVCQNLTPGDVVLLENLRFYKAEKENAPEFAKQLAQLAEVYVNDAFGAAHRAHASIEGVTKHVPFKYAGLLLQAEVANAKRVLEEAQSPYTAIVGGAKVSDKIGIIENLLPKVDELIIGGGMAYTFLKAQGHNIGNSLCEDDKLGLAKDILAKAESSNTQIHLPVDHVVAARFAEDAEAQLIDGLDIPEGMMGLDIGPKSLQAFSRPILAAKTLLWNGPMGVFEFAAFAQGTLEVARAVAHATEMGAYSLVGGGDSAAAVQQMGLAEHISYVSTGGGALLEMLEGKTLPGIAALSA